MVVDLVKKVEKDTKDKIKEVVMELELTSKEDNYHYLEDYQKEDLQMLDSKLFMQQLMLEI